MKVNLGQSARYDIRVLILHFFFSNYSENRGVQPLNFSRLSDIPYVHEIWVATRIACKLHVYHLTFSCKQMPKGLCREQFIVDWVGSLLMLSVAVFATSAGFMCQDLVNLRCKQHKRVSHKSKKPSALDHLI